MKRVSIDWNAKSPSVRRRAESRNSWTEHMDDELDVRKLLTGRKLDKVRRAQIGQNGLTAR